MSLILLKISKWAKETNDVDEDDDEEEGVLKNASRQVLGWYTLILDPWCAQVLKFFCGYLSSNT